MKNLKKITALLGITVLSATMVFGCGKKADETTAATTEASTTEAAADTSAEGADGATLDLTEDSKYLEWKLSDWEAADDEAKTACAYTYTIAAARMMDAEFSEDDIPAPTEAEMKTVMDTVEMTLKAAPDMTIQQMLDASASALEQLETMEVPSETAAE